MKVTIFGGAKPQPGEAAYLEAYRLGALLARGGHSVITGGYMGTMEAASRGAAEAGGHVIGMTCEEIERWRPIQPNAWVIEEIRHATLHDRLLGLIDLCDGAIALPGGPGTLAEISMMWNQLIVSAIPAKPLILCGSGWQTTINTFTQQFQAYIRENDRAWLSYADSVEEAAELLSKPK